MRLRRRSWALRSRGAGRPWPISIRSKTVVAAENGDDSDYNDTILEFSWHTLKG
ncbi:fucose-binding lectin II [Streptomyces lateritius]|uniref:fucose-binding lectin II n=1 Tax=Streptomyces lateritius TaxID=67313 RepID=UPI0016762423|nr:fucose-binding lectin II [Streptomyces lateritius]GGU10774.1 hypothetical protein GCM10010272_64680 [Streptomyces lateritius]